MQAFVPSIAIDRFKRVGNGWKQINDIYLLFFYTDDLLFVQLLQDNWIDCECFQRRNMYYSYSKELN